MSLIDKYCNAKTVLKSDIMIGDYELLIAEIKDYLSKQNKREFLLDPTQKQTNVLRLINTLSQLEADALLLSKHLNKSEQYVKENGYSLRNTTTTMSNFTEDFFFKDEFKQGDYVNNFLKDEYLIEANWGQNEKLVVTQNNNTGLQSMYDLDGRIDNTNIFVDIKGRYEKRKTLRNIEIDDSYYLDEKTILKYYCRKIHDNADIWFVMYHNYGPGDFGFNFMSFNTLLSYINIKLNKSLASKLPTTEDLLNNKFNDIPLTISVNENMNNAFKVINPQGSNVIEIVDFNNKKFINFNYKVLSCSRSKFINVLTK
jgi:hypothetical protein